MPSRTARYATAEVLPLRRPPCPNWPRVLPSLALLLSLALNPAAQAADLNARVSPPGPDGTLELTLESSRAPMTEPDLSPSGGGLRDPGAEASATSRFLVNGRRSDIHSLTLTLRPRHPGVTEVPAITYGEAASEPLRLETSPAQPRPEPKIQIPAQAPAARAAAGPTPGPTRHRAAQRGARRDPRPGGRHPAHDGAGPAAGDPDRPGLHTRGGRSPAPPSAL